MTSPARAGTCRISAKIGFMLMERVFAKSADEGPIRWWAFGSSAGDKVCRCRGPSPGDWPATKSKWSAPGMSCIDSNIRVNYSCRVFTVRKTALFDKWLRKLPDRRATARIASRIQRLEHGHLGEVKYLANAGLGEIRLDYGPGYRLYFWKHHPTLVLLCGGHKDTQRRDIERARKMAKELQNDL